MHEKLSSNLSNFHIPQEMLYASKRSAYKTMLVITTVSNDTRYKICQHKLTHLTGIRINVEFRFRQQIVTIIKTMDV